MKISELKEKLNQIENDDIEIFVAPLIEMTRLTGDSEETSTTIVASPFSRFELKTMNVSGTIGDGALGNFFLLLGYDASRSYGLDEMSGVEDAGDLVN